MTVDRVPGTLDTWEYEWRHPQLRHKKIVELFRSIKSNTPLDIRYGGLLDIGCGAGNVTKMIMDVLEVQYAYGVDILGEYVEPPEGLMILKVDVGQECLPFGEGCFDVIYSGELLEHLYDPDFLLDEIYRVMSDDGVCVFTTPNLASWVNRIVLFFGYHPYNISVSEEFETAGKWGINKGFHGQWAHIRPFTPKALKTLLHMHGFKVEKFIGWNIGDLSIHTDGYKAKVVEFFDRMFSKIPSLASRMVVIVRKEEVLR